MPPPRSTEPIESDIGELYGLPPEEFIPARDRTAKRLKDEGKGEQAQRFKSLRRPTVPAWAVNQVVRLNESEVDELLAAGEDLRRAQQRALSGKSGADLRKASERRRTAIRAVMQAAEALLDEAGRSSPAHVDAIRTTFEAASLDRDAAARVREGRLVKELDAAAGFGDVGGLTLVPGLEGAPAKTASKRAELEAQRRAEAKRQVQAAKARAAALKREADRAEREAAKAEREAERARAEAARLRKQAEDAQRNAERQSKP